MTDYLTGSITDNYWKNVQLENNISRCYIWTVVPKSHLNLGSSPFISLDLLLSPIKGVHLYYLKFLQVMYENLSSWVILLGDGIIKPT